MPIAPLWVADRSTLIAELRLSGTAGLPDASALIDQATERARIRIYTRLGSARVADITATAYAENPTTDAGIVRATARQLEIKLVHCILMDLLPLLFLDGNSVRQEWNEIDGRFRASTADERAGLKTVCMGEVEDMFKVLDGSITLGQLREMRVYTQTKPTPLPRPGATPWVRQPHGDGDLVNPGDFDGNFIR